MNVEGADYRGRTNGTIKQELYFSPQNADEQGFLQNFLHQPVTVVRTRRGGRDCYAFVFEQHVEQPVEQPETPARARRKTKDSETPDE